MGKIQKVPGAMTNSFMTEMKGFSLYPQTLKSQHINTTVIFTSDDHGETLSVFDPTTKKQIIIAFEEIEKLITYTRQKRELELNKSEL